MAKTWRFQNVDSDLDISGQVYGDIMNDAGSGTRAQTAAPASGTTTGYYISPSGLSLVGQSNTGSWTVVLNVGTAASGTEAEVYLRRYNSSGVQQDTVTMATSPTSTATTGDKTFTATNPALGVWAAGDRLVVAVLVRNTNLHGGSVGPTWDLAAANTRLDSPHSFVTVRDIAVTLDATAALAVATQRIVDRAVTLEAVADISAAPVREAGVVTRDIAITVDATADIVADTSRDVFRSIAVDAVADITAALVREGSNPYKVQNLQATAISTTAIDLSWDDVTDLTGETYDVERDGAVVEYEYAGAHTPGDPYHDTGLDPNTQYTYRVRASSRTE